MIVRPFVDEDLEPVVELSLRAWEPVFAALEREMGQPLYRLTVPDWRQSQRSAVTSVCIEEQAPPMRVWLASREDGDVAETGVAAGFVALRVHAQGTDEQFGEIYMVAVDPAQQQRGVGRALCEHAIAVLREEGVKVAMVETGQDSGHAPARRLYESLEFQNVPAARYWKVL